MVATAAIVITIIIVFISYPPLFDLYRIVLISTTPIQDRDYKLCFNPPKKSMKT